MERKEPTLTKITPDRDEVAARQRRHAERGPMPRPPSSAPASGGPASGLVASALILAVIGLGGSGYLGWKLYETEQVLQQSSERIANLEQRLDITYDESNESVEAIQAKLQWADSEIRKLWGVSYDTNRGNIAGNSEKIEALNQDLKAVQSNVSSLESNSESARVAVADLEASLSSVRDAVTELDSDVSALGGQRARLQNLAEELDQLSDQVARLDGLGDRVQTNEEAIEAIDAFRRNINQEVRDLQDQVSQGAQVSQQTQGTP